MCSTNILKVTTTKIFEELFPDISGQPQIAMQSKLKVESYRSVPKKREGNSRTGKVKTGVFFWYEKGILFIDYHAKGESYAVCTSVTFLKQRYTYI